MCARRRSRPVIGRVSAASGRWLSRLARSTQVLARSVRDEADRQAARARKFFEGVNAVESSDPNLREIQNRRDRRGPSTRPRCVRNTPPSEMSAVTNVLRFRIYQSRVEQKSDAFSAKKALAYIGRKRFAKFSCTPSKRNPVSLQQMNKFLAVRVPARLRTFEEIHVFEQGQQHQYSSVTSSCMTPIVCTETCRRRTGKPLFGFYWNRRHLPVDALGFEKCISRPPAKSDIRSAKTWSAQ